MNSPGGRVRSQLWLLALAIGAALSFVVFFQLRAFEAARSQSEFAERADDRFSAIDINMALSIDRLKAVGVFFSGSEPVTRARFRHVVAPLIEGDRAIQALEWIPRVTEARRPAYEATLRQESATDPEIREKAADGTMMRAQSREEYFPVQFVEPPQGNERAQQYDLGSSPARLAALERAGQTGQMVATSRIALVQEAAGEFGVLVLRPSYAAGTDDGRTADWRSDIAGFTLGVFRIGSLLAEESAEDAARSGIYLALFDEDAPKGERLLYPRAHEKDWDAPSDIAAACRQERRLSLGGRKWKAVAYCAAGSFAPERWTSGAALAFGLVVSLLLAAYVRLAVRRRGEIEATVLERTAELRRMQADLIGARDAAEAGSRAKSNFLATVSHELRTPMNGVIGFAELLLLPGTSAEEGEHFARTILSSSKVLLALLDDILDLSRIEAGKMHLAAEPMDCERELADLKALFGESARAKSLQLDLDWKGGNGAIYLADPVRVKQILGNLISNALKFTSQGRVTVLGDEVSRDAEGATLEFTVSDTGMGIPADKIGSLFQPFTQVDEFHKASKGTGLGLSIVRKLARLMGGDADVQSRVGEGSRFRVRIRVGHATPDSVLSPASRFSSNNGRAPVFR